MLDPKPLLLACLASTLFMTGVIWFVDRVHYPLFARVSGPEFRVYHEEHGRRTTLVVIVPMVVELATAALLVANRPPGTPRWLAWAGLAAAVVTWLATALLSVPMHEALGRGFDAQAHRRLVATDALRVGAWTAHSLILLRMAAGAMR